MLILKRSILALGLLSLGAAGVGGQQAEPLAEPWRWAEYPIGDGGGSEFVRVLLDDDDGHMWALLPTGPAWFDGFEWVRVDPPEASGAVEFQHMKRRAGGGVILSTGLRLFEARTDGMTEIDLGLPPGAEIWQYASAGIDDLLMTTTEGPKRLRMGILEDLPSDGLATNRFFFLSRLRNGRVVGRAADSVHEWTGSGWIRVAEFAAPPNFSPIRSRTGAAFLLEDSQARMGLIPVPNDAGASDFIPVDLPSPLTAFDISPSGELVVLSSYDQGAIRRAGAWIDISPFPSALQGATQLRYAPNGDLWAAGPRGLFLGRVTAERWTYWPSASVSGLDEVSVNALLDLPDGSLWMATADGVVVRHPDGRAERIQSVDGRRLGAVTGMAHDTEGGIWITSGSHPIGALRYHQGEWSVFAEADGLTMMRFHRVSVDRTGTVWLLGLGSQEELSTGRSGAFAWDGTAFEHWGPARGLSAQRVYDVTRDASGGLHFGTLEGIHSYVEETDEWTVRSVGAGLRNAKVFTIEGDTGGSLWFGHQNDAVGLGRMNRQGFISYLGVDDGAADGGVWDLALGDDGAIWATSRGGLTQVSDEGVIRFGVEEGLDAPFTWPVLPTSDEVHIGTVGRGLLTLSLDERSNPAPRVRIHEVDGSTDPIQLRWDVFPYRGETDPAAAQSRYRIDRGAWSPWSTDHGALVNLRWGRHDLEVQSRSLFGTAGDPLAAEFRVAHPVLRTPVTRIALAVWLLSMLVGAGLYSRRRRVHLADVKERERYFRSLIENASDMIAVLDDDGVIQYVSPSIRDILGSDPDLVAGAPFTDLVIDVDREVVKGLLDESKAHHTHEERVSVRFRHEKEAEVRTLELAVRGEEAFGEFRTVLHGRDRTDQERTEARLRQAMKMEAVGQLTGGVAHDFNNLLTVIIGELDLLSEDGVEDDGLELARDAAGRAAELTSRLLSFSRQQPLRPRSADLAELVPGLADLLRRTLPETVQVEIDLRRRPCLVRIDPGQFENAILNLAINARDAMPDGGDLRIIVDTTEITEGAFDLDTDVVPGSYATVTVADTGAGIPRARLDSIFEPFFTTKGVGKGSGLGLSMVYGFVKQSDGYITVDSEVGVGTSVHIHLPLVDDTAPSA